MSGNAGDKLYQKCVSGDLTREDFQDGFEKEYKKGETVHLTVAHVEKFKDEPVTFDGKTLTINPTRKAPLIDHFDGVYQNTAANISDPKHLKAKWTIPGKACHWDGNNDSGALFCARAYSSPHFIFSCWLRLVWLWCRTSLALPCARVSYVKTQLFQKWSRSRRTRMGTTSSSAAAGIASGPSSVCMLPKAATGWRLCSEKSRYRYWAYACSASSQPLMQIVSR